MGFSTRSWIRCGVVRWKFVERVRSCREDESCSISVLAFTAKRGVSAPPTRVRVKTGSESAFLSIAPMGFCLYYLGQCVKACLEGWDSEKGTFVSVRVTGVTGPRTGISESRCMRLLTTTGSKGSSKALPPVLLSLNLSTTPIVTFLTFS